MATVFRQPMVLWRRWFDTLRERFAWKQAIALLCVMLAIVAVALPARADINNDRYDGNIFALYGSDGGIVPPRTPLDESISQRVPTLLVYYVEDSSDCKRYSGAIGNLHTRYGLGVNFVVLNVDSFDVGTTEGAGRFFTGQVPQTLLFDPDGEIVYRSLGDRPITEVENAIRAIFDLAPVEPGELRRQPFNELQTGFQRTGA